MGLEEGPWEARRIRRGVPTAVYGWTNKASVSGEAWEVEGDVSLNLVCMCSPPAPAPNTITVM